MGTLASFPLLLPHSVWDQLADWAKRLSAEVFAAEMEMLRTPAALDCLDLPRCVRGASRTGRDGLTPAAGRVIRFDFHLTSGSPGTGGWQISEANCDVPGGYTEASSFTAMMAREFPAHVPAGDPAGRADAISPRWR